MACSQGSQVFARALVLVLGYTEYGFATLYRW
jgi:hypothetical protein